MKVNSGSVQLGNSTRVEMSTRVEIIANSHVNAKFFNSGRVEIKALHCRWYAAAFIWRHLARWKAKKEGALAYDRRKFIHLSFNLILEFILLFTCNGSFIKDIFFSNRPVFSTKS